MMHKTWVVIDWQLRLATLRRPTGAAGGWGGHWLARMSTQRLRLFLWNATRQRVPVNLFRSTSEDTSRPEPSPKCQPFLPISSLFCFVTVGQRWVNTMLAFIFLFSFPVPLERSTRWANSSNVFSEPRCACNLFISLLKSVGQKWKCHNPKIM